MVKKKQKREWVVYPEIELTIDDIVEHLKSNNSNKMEEKNEVEAMPVDEITAEINAEVAAETEAEGISAEELLDLAETMDLTDEQKKEIFIQQLKESKIKFRPTKHGVKITETSVKSQFGDFRKHRTAEIQTNVTVNQFGVDYKKTRQRKNKEQRASRKANR
jgi:hypothetical protein